ncbi:bsl7690 [Bradyrhizobium diazoefficiens USDA 110]|uniref:Bsl7690 protein n=1 Tax=Bradyrhizobium diazoefficiens (strain JCM 10833 / BCRC 13528 / IAM 13628 / NBRC 14792 / USDA 110) TaxID=224911 RepID=Q89CV5_BRADU|nr:hypothetical protein CO678_42235 [Bradyrhizobium diazoefficiens]QBP26428.1 hypothetical protein Bdiaspc4_40640 [Bradyrhizobium diazoefficiens]QHP68045.1 hypothetical protein EI171_12630 [Bradyrhizobium sp. LCT2]BAC52955.1 bsl7690 [Bradyrhizobium diazoefficiens USDA 110]
MCTLGLVGCGKHLLRVNKRLGRMAGPRAKRTFGRTGSSQKSGSYHPLADKFSAKRPRNMSNLRTDAPRQGAAIRSEALRKS